MRRFLFPIVILISCFCAANVWAQKNAMDIDLKKEKAAAQELSDSSIVMRSTFTAEGEIKQGGLLFLSGYEFSDGISVKTSEGDYKSSEIAREHFQGIIKRALKVIEKKETNSKIGKTIIGEKALVVLASLEEGKYTFARIEWHDGFLKETESSSLKHLLAYELKNKKEN